MNKKESGQGFVEYALILVFVIIVLVLIVASLRDLLDPILESIRNSPGIEFGTRWEGLKLFIKTLGTTP